MFGLSIWKNWTKSCGITPNIQREQSSASGLQKELHCGGKIAEKLRALAVGDKVQIAYAEIDSMVTGKVILE